MINENMPKYNLFEKEKTENIVANKVICIIFFCITIILFITAIVFASSFGGIGALLSVIPVFIYQGGIELGAGALQGPLMNCINEISATGSVIVVALCLNMTGATKIKIANMLPAVFLPILFCLFM